MRHRKSPIGSLTHTAFLNPLFVALFVYGFALWVFHLWLFLGVMDDKSELKAWVLGPRLGSFHIIYLLSFLNSMWLLLFGSQAVRAWNRKLHPRWQALSTPVAALVLVISMQVYVVYLDGFASRIDNQVHSDQEMLARFAKQRKNFKDVVVGVKVDMARKEDGRSSSLWYVADGWERWQWYSTRLRKAGIYREVTVSRKGDRLEFLDSVNAIGTRGSFKGYLYSESPPSPLASNLDAFTADGIELDIYRVIEGNWYLFLRQRP